MMDMAGRQCPVPASGEKKYSFWLLMKIDTHAIVVVETLVGLQWWCLFGPVSCSLNATTT